MPKLHEGADVVDPSIPWKWRVVRASMGSTTGAIVMAMLAKVPKRGPALGKLCDISADGWVVTSVRRPGSGIWLQNKRIGKLVDVRDNLRRLADHCKLDDADREALFEEFRKWIRRDQRATSGEPVCLSK